MNKSLLTAVFIAGVTTSILLNEFSVESVSMAEHSKIELAGNAPEVSDWMPEPHSDDVSQSLRLQGADALNAAVSVPISDIENAGVENLDQMTEAEIVALFEKLKEQGEDISALLIRLVEEKGYSPNTLLIHGLQPLTVFQFAIGYDADLTAEEARYFIEKGGYLAPDLSNFKPLANLSQPATAVYLMQHAGFGPKEEADLFFVSMVYGNQSLFDYLLERNPHFASDRKLADSVEFVLHNLQSEEEISTRLIHTFQKNDSVTFENLKLKQKSIYEKEIAKRTMLLRFISLNESQKAFLRASISEFEHKIDTI